MQTQVISRMAGARKTNTVSALRHTAATGGATDCAAIVWVSRTAWADRDLPSARAWFEAQPFGRQEKLVNGIITIWAPSTSRMSVRFPITTGPEGIVRTTWKFTAFA